MSTESDRMQLDAGFLPRVRVTREIPLWQIIVAVLAFAGQAVAVYYGQQDQARELKRLNDRQAEMATDIKAIAGDTQKGGMKALELGFAITNLEQRVRTLENAQMAPLPAQRR